MCILHHGHKNGDCETSLCCFALQKDHANSKNHDGVTAADGVSGDVITQSSDPADRFAFLCRGLCFGARGDLSFLLMWFNVSLGSQS